MFHVFKVIYNFISLGGCLKMDCYLQKHSLLAMQEVSWPWRMLRKAVCHTWRFVWCFLIVFFCYTYWCCLFAVYFFFMVIVFCVNSHCGVYFFCFFSFFCVWCLVQNWFKTCVCISESSNLCKGHYSEKYRNETMSILTWGGFFFHLKDCKFVTCSKLIWLTKI